MRPSWPTGLSDDDIRDLAKFVLNGQIDADDIADADNGQALYDTGLGGSLAWAICHDAGGLTIMCEEPPYEEFIDGLASGNPWEFQHKVRFGQPGTAMPSSVAGSGTTQDVADIGAYAQTLPEAP